MLTIAAEKTAAPALTEIPALTLKDVCDGHASGVASAYVRVAVPSELKPRYVDLCGHCFAEHEVTILEHGYRVRDERTRLLARDSAETTETQQPGENFL